MTHHNTLVQRCRSTNALLADELEREFARLENDRADAGQEIELLREAIEPFVKAAAIIDRRPQDYSDRVVMIGGLEDASDIRKFHFTRLLAASKQ